MFRQHQLILTLSAVLAVGGGLIDVTFAQLSSDHYQIDSLDLNGGGSRASGSSYYSIEGTMGQRSVAGKVTSPTGTYGGIHGYQPGTLTKPQVDLTSWKSVRLHGRGVGEKGIPLDPDSGHNPTIEPRLYRVQKIVVNFNPTVPVRLVSGKSLDIDIYDGVNHATGSTQSETLTSNYTQLVAQFAPDALGDLVRVTISLSDRIASPSGLIPGNDRDCQIRCVVGDINNTNSVNMIDAGAIKAENRKAVTNDNFRFDLNVDGLINLLDVALAKSRYGSSAP